jgi:aspartate 1-decarboxylase
MINAFATLYVWVHIMLMKIGGFPSSFPHFISYTRLVFNTRLIDENEKVITMMRNMCKGKIHRAKVTEAKLEYVGSITIDSDLMEAANLMPYEMVQVTNVSNAVLWTTYTIPAPAGSGIICLNGPPARLFQPGDEVIILSLAWMDEDEIDELRSHVVFVNEKNKITQVEVVKPYEDWIQKGKYNKFN